MMGTIFLPLRSLLLCYGVFSAGGNTLYQTSPSFLACQNPRSHKVDEIKRCQMRSRASRPSSGFCSEFKHFQLETVNVNLGRGAKSFSQYFPHCDESRGKRVSQGRVEIWETKDESQKSRTCAGRRGHREKITGGFAIRTKSVHLSTSPSLQVIRGA